MAKVLIVKPISREFFNCNVCLCGSDYFCLIVVAFSAIVSLAFNCFTSCKPVLGTTG